MPRRAPALPQEIIVTPPEGYDPQQVLGLLKAGPFRQVRPGEDGETVEVRTHARSFTAARRSVRQNLAKRLGEVEVEGFRIGQPLP
jgi:hypothetical protein